LVDNKTKLLRLQPIKRASRVDVSRLLRSDETGDQTSEPHVYTPLNNRYVFYYRAAWMQTRSSDEKAIRHSVCLSVCQTLGLWQNGRKICPYFYTIRKII